MEHMFSRRSLLLHGARTLGAVSLVSRFGILSAMASASAKSDPPLHPIDPRLATPPYKALVCIFLAGGNDAFNMVAPYEQSIYTPYFNARPTVALPRTGAGAMLPIASVAQGAQDFGLHPNLTLLQPLYNQGKVAVVANLGTLIQPIKDKAEYAAKPQYRPKSLFDHGIQTDTWQELGADEGWGNGIGKILELRAANPNPTIPVLVNVTGGASVYMTGTAPYITLPPGSQNGRLLLQGFTTSASDTARMNALRALYRIPHPNPVVKAISDRTDKAIDDGKTASDALAAATITTVFPNTGLGNQMKQIATIIKARNSLNANNRQVFFASLGGFDTHENEATTHPSLMQQLGDAMAAFYQATVELGVDTQVTTFTLSEFGRTIQNSGSGTDHAWGSNAFVMGGGVQGGKFFGTYPSLVLAGPNDIDTGANARGRMLPTTSVDQYAATLCKWFGISFSDMSTFLPNLGKFSPTDLGFMGP